MALASVLCCFNSKTAMYLEKTNLIITTILIIIYIFKLCSIPWGATSYSREFLGVLTFIFLVINLVLVFLFFLLRLKNMINEYNYKSCFIISCVMIFISLLSFFFEITLMFVVLEDLYYYTGTYYITTNEVVVTDAEWFIAFFTIVSSVIFWFIIFMLWISECIRVVMKTSGTLEDYINDNNVEVIIINQKDKKKVNAYDNKGAKISEKKDSTVKPKKNSSVNITYV